MNTEERIKLYDSLMEKVNKPGKEDLREWLIHGSDFFTAPASSVYHNNRPGGLFDHSCNVMRFALQLNAFVDVKYNIRRQEEAAIIFSAIHHDVCKVNYYKKGKKFTKPGTKWIEYEAYMVDDRFPMGHGERSVYYLTKFVKLTDEEALAIRWHMGYFIQESHISFPSGNDMRKAMDMYPLVKLIQMADSCTMLVEPTIDYKQVAERGAV